MGVWRQLTERRERIKAQRRKEKIIKKAGYWPEYQTERLQKKVGILRERAEAEAELARVRKEHRKLKPRKFAALQKVGAGLAAVGEPARKGGLLFTPGYGHGARRGPKGRTVVVGPRVARTPLPAPAAHRVREVTVHERPPAPAASVAPMPDTGMRGHQMLDMGMPDMSIVGFGGPGRRPPVRKQRKRKRERDFLDDLL